MYFTCCAEKPDHLHAPNPTYSLQVETEDIVMSKTTTRSIKLIGAILAAFILIGCVPLQPLPTSMANEDESANDVAVEALSPAVAVADIVSDTIDAPTLKQPKATVLSSSLNMRAGPGLNYLVIDVAYQGDTYIIAGQAFDCGWLQVLKSDGSLVWISGNEQYSTFAPACDQISVANIPPSPTPTQQPETRASEESPAQPETPPRSEAAPQEETPTQPDTSAPQEETPAQPDTSAQQAEDPLPADQGCFLMENFVSAELTCTFTAQGWNWNTSYTVAPMGQQVICLSPGRYSYTIDAPPPWHVINGDITIVAGERFLFPIVGEE